MFYSNHSLNDFTGLGYPKDVNAGVDLTNCDDLWRRVTSQFAIIAARKKPFTGKFDGNRSNISIRYPQYVACMQQKGLQPQPNPLDAAIVSGSVQPAKNESVATATANIAKIVALPGAPTVPGTTVPALTTAGGAPVQMESSGGSSKLPWLGIGALVVGGAVIYFMTRKRPGRSSSVRRGLYRKIVRARRSARKASRSYRRSKYGRK